MEMATQDPVEKLDAALDAYEEGAEQIVMESSLKDPLTWAKYVFRYNPDFQPEIELEDYLNSPWRKIIRLAKIASGTKRKRIGYTSPLNACTMSVYTADGTERALDPTNTNHCTVVCVDWGEGHYQLELQIGLKYLSDEQDAYELRINPNTYRYLDFQITRQIIGAQYCRYLNECCPPMFCSIEFPQTGSDQTIRVQFQRPMPKTFSTMIYAEFYRCKGSFKVVKINS